MEMVITAWLFFAVAVQQNTHNFGQIRRKTRNDLGIDAPKRYRRSHDWPTSTDRTNQPNGYSQINEEKIGGTATKIHGNGMIWADQMREHGHRDDNGRTAKTTAGMVSAEQQRRNRPRGKISDEQQRRHRPEGMITAVQQREQPTAWKISAEQQNGNTGTRQQKQETARKVTRLVMTMKWRQARWEGFPGRCTIKCWIENSNTSFAGQLCSNRCTELYSQQKYN